MSVQAEEDVLVQTKDPAVRIDSDGFVVINGGTYVSSGLEGQGSGCVEQNSGSITITGGDFTGRDAAFYIGEGVANFKGGTFTSQDLMGAALQMSGGEVDIESGTFVGKGGGQAFFMDSGAATVSGGKFISEDGIGIWNAKGAVYDPAQLTINDCTVNAKEVALYFSGTEDNEVNGGTYTSETTNALNVYQSGVVISSGIFTNAAGGAAIKDGQNGLTVAEGSAADPANWKETSASVVRISFPVASIGDKAYPSLEEAFAASKDGDTIVLLKDIVNYDRPAIEVNKKVTLDFNEHKITVNENMFQVNENASLTLKNADVQQIMTSDAFYVEYAFIKDCKGELIIDSTAGGDIDLGEALINTLYSTGSITVNGGTVKSLQRVIKKVEAGAKVTINDGELIADNGKSGDYKNGVIISSCEGDFELNGGKLSPAVTAMHIDEPGSVLLNGGVIESGVEGIYVEGDCKVEVNDIEINAPLGCLSVEGGELIVNNGTFNAKHGYAILVKNTENAVINNGTFQSNDKCVAVGDSSITFNGGTYSLTNPVTDDECECVVLYNSSAKIKGGEFRTDIVSTIVLYDSELVMDGGTIYSETNGIEVIGGQAIVNDGTIDTSEGSECIFIAQKADNPRDLTDKVIINGGNFTAGENRYCVWSKYGHIIVNDGTFQAGSACIFNETGENEINGGTFTSQNSAAVRMDNNANLTLTGGKFINESGEAALPDQENIVIADGYKADPEEWKEASVVEIILDVREYVIIEGADSKWKNGSKEGLKFRANGEYAKFIDVSVDGKTLKNSYYKAWSGSTYVELQPDYLKTLSVGKHSLKVQYTDGSAETVFTILDTNPDTADHSSTILWIVMALIFGTAVVVSGRKFADKR
ncbi:MAG: hypothetical protein MJ092_03465 [Lachnospiraceae bacterium]|nr:hypothetical protein [Lachnospiraceae bacterium]